MFNVDFVLIESQAQLVEQAAYRPIGTVCYTPGGTYAWQLGFDRKWVALHAFGFNCSSDAPAAATVWDPVVIWPDIEGNNEQIYEVTKDSNAFTVYVDLSELVADDDSNKMIKVAVQTAVTDISRIMVNGAYLTDAQIAESKSYGLPGGSIVVDVDAVAAASTPVSITLKAEYCPDLTITLATTNYDIPAIEVALSAALPDSAEEANVGDTVTYTAVVTNTGEMALTGVTIEDSLVELQEDAFNLDIEGTKTITYTYTVTEDDLTAGSITNTVTVTGSAEGRDDVTAVDDATVTVVVPESDDSGDTTES